jgi:DHA3 family tetracycline resistance protein-like MFS transporter
MNRKLNAYTIYLIMSGSFSIFFTMMGMISAIYRVQTAGLNPLQLVLVGTVLELTVFIFEIPTGIVADLKSRRLSVIIGYFLIGVGFMVEGAFPFFATILLAQVIWGIGATFTSGAEEAWLADELGEDGLTQVYLRGSQLAQIGTLIGIGLSVLIGQVAFGLPMFIGGLMTVLMAGFLVLFMPETGFKPAESTAEQENWKKMGDTFKQGLALVRGQRVLMLIMATTFFFGLSSEGLDRLWEAHFLENITFPALASVSIVTWFGIINVGQLLLNLGLTEVVRRRVKTDNDSTAVLFLLIVSVVNVLSLVVFALAANFPIGLVAIWSVTVTRRISGPIRAAWMNKKLKSGTRATVISMSGQLDAIGQFVGGPIIGAVGTAFLLRWAMLGVALFVSPVILIYRKILNLERQRELDLIQEVITAD